MRKILSVEDGVTEVFHGHPDGSFTIEQTADIEPLLNRNHEMSDSFRGEDMHYVGSVDCTTIWRWLIEDGVTWEKAMNDKDVWRRVVLRRLHDPDFRKFKIAPGSYL